MSDSVEAPGEQWSTMLFMALSGDGPWMDAQANRAKTRVVVGNYPGSEDWMFVVPTRWEKAPGSRQTVVYAEPVVCIPPSGLDPVADAPEDRELEWIRHLAVVWHNGGFPLRLALEAMVLEYRPGRHDSTARHHAVRTMFARAREEGVDPRQPIATLYGVNVRTVDRWRTAAIDAGVMPEYDPARDVPQPWPPPQFRNQEGPHAGRHLELRATRPPVTYEGRLLAGLDLVVQGHWLDGAPFPGITLTKVNRADEAHRLIELTRRLENDDYPGSTVRITISARYGLPETG